MLTTRRGTHSRRRLNATITAQQTTEYTNVWNTCCASMHNSVKVKFSMLNSFESNERGFILRDVYLRIAGVRYKKKLVKIKKAR